MGCAHKLTAIWWVKVVIVFGMTFLEVKALHNIWELEYSHWGERSCWIIWEIWGALHNGPPTLPHPVTMVVQTTDIGLERLNVGAPDSAWELEFHLWCVKNQLYTRELRQWKCKNGKKTLFYLRRTSLVSSLMNIDVGKGWWSWRLCIVSGNLDCPVIMDGVKLLRWRK